MAILGLQPVPPPRWVIDASARVGKMWGDFTTQFRGTPVPKEWMQNGPVPGSKDLTWEDLRTSYYQAMDDVSEPIKARARAAFTSCQGMSKKYGYTDDLSKSCDVWLQKNTPPAP